MDYIVWQKSFNFKRVSISIETDGLSFTSMSGLISIINKKNYFNRKRPKEANFIANIVIK
jgi:hypothetical protein